MIREVRRGWRQTPECRQHKLWQCTQRAHAHPPHQLPALNRDWALGHALRARPTLTAFSPPWPGFSKVHFPLFPHATQSPVPSNCTPALETPRLALTPQLAATCYCLLLLHTIDTTVTVTITTTSAVHFSQSSFRRNGRTFVSLLRLSMPVCALDRLHKPSLPQL